MSKGWELRVVLVYIFHSVEYFGPILNYLSEIRGYKGFPKM